MTASATAPMQIGMVTLNVRQLDMVADYYRRALGLSDCGRDGNTLRLGVAGKPLLELRGNTARQQRSPKSAGLFHTAFLMPDRSSLASWLRHVAGERIPVDGASDHWVSEALYLHDPEGNGIEVYADRPRSSWDTNGKQVAMSTDHLDLRDLMDFSADTMWSGAPAGLFVGHLHLQVGDTGTAEKFYAGVLGADITAHYPGASFYGAGGYHHQLATNTWSSRGAGMIDAEETGLVGFELVLDNAAQRAAILARARSSQTTIADPWGLSITLDVIAGE